MLRVFNGTARHVNQVCGSPGVICAALSHDSGKEKTIFLVEFSYRS
jgi:hypothetical protein